MEILFWPSTDKNTTLGFLFLQPFLNLLTTKMFLYLLILRDRERLSFNSLFNILSRTFSKWDLNNRSPLNAILHSLKCVTPASSAFLFMGCFIALMSSKDHFSWTFLMEKHPIWDICT